MPRKRSVCAIAATALLAVAVGCTDTTDATSADPQFDQKGLGRGGHPGTFRFVDEFDVVVPAGALCEFAVGAVGANKVMVQVFQTHMVIHLNNKATITNLATGFSFRDNGAWKDVLHFDEMGNLETVTTIGSIVRVTLPGVGMLVQDTGILPFDPFTGDVSCEGGPHEASHGTAPGFCDTAAG